MRSNEMIEAVRNIEQRKCLIAQWTIDLSTMLYREGVQFNPETISLGELERELVRRGRITVPVTT